MCCFQKLRIFALSADIFVVQPEYVSCNRLLLQVDISVACGLVQYKWKNEEDTFYHIYFVGCLFGHGAVKECSEKDIRCG